jgi:hypothetical protein
VASDANHALCDHLFSNQVEFPLLKREVGGNLLSEGTAKPITLDRSIRLIVMMAT